MAKVLTDSQHYTDIAAAIREKNGTETTYKPSEMAEAIRGIQSGGGADFSEVEYKLSGGYTNYAYYFSTHSSMTEVPTELIQHTAESTRFNQMFIGCISLLTVPFFDTSKGTNFNGMFNNCNKLKSLPQFDVSNGDNFATMVSSCSALTSVPKFNTSNGTNFSSMFSGCTNLVTIEGVDFTSATKVGSTFDNCSKLENIIINGVIKLTGLSFASCSKLTHDSLMSIINALYDYAADGSTDTYTISLNSTNLAKLTDAEKAIATQKGWTLA